MRKIFLVIFLTIINFIGISGSELNNELIKLGITYRNFMFRNTPTLTTFEQLEAIKSEELKTTKKFITEVITTNNKLTTSDFLKLPDEKTLKYIYIIRRINWNLREENPIGNNEIISEITNKTIQRYELIDCYYDLLFSGIANKNQPFNLSNVDFQINEYDLKDDTEKGILFLKAMDLCGKVIWGYMNIVNPHNYKKTLENIDKYPKFNGQPYYQYLDFSFSDFEMVIEKDEDKESYKHYYINKYYNTLLYHLECLNQKKKFDKARTNLLLGSILKESIYYKYSDKKESLEKLFTTIDK